jgi:hypothetical protein
MTFLELHRWRDGRPLHVEASAIICLSVIEHPADRRSDEPDAPATVINLGMGGFSEWVRETPDETIALVQAARGDRPGRPLPPAGRTRSAQPASAASPPAPADETGGSR